MNTPMGMLGKALFLILAARLERLSETLHEVARSYHASVPRYWSKLASRIIVGIENSSTASVELQSRHCALLAPIAARWDGRGTLWR